MASGLSGYRDSFVSYAKQTLFNSTKAFQNVKDVVTLCPMYASVLKNVYYFCQSMRV